MNRYKALMHRRWQLALLLGAAATLGSTQGCMPSDRFDKVSGCDGSACKKPGPVVGLPDDDGGAPVIEIDASKPEPDAGSPTPDTGSSMPDAATADATASQTPASLPPGATCTRDAECNDGLYCNGVETCIPVRPGTDVKHCWRPEAGPCADRACDEIAQCDCSEPDRDGDGIPIAGCARKDEKADCDDYDRCRYPQNPERCNPDDPLTSSSLASVVDPACAEAYADPHHDEDCDPETTGNRDEDDDGFMDQRCANWDARYLFYVAGADCNDNGTTGHDMNPMADEVCDDQDNDCDGQTDEVYGQPAEKLNYFYRDRDYDLWGSDNPDDILKTLCQHAPTGYSVQHGDCNDADRLVNPGREEVCNGKDDDCLNGVDEPLVEDGLLLGEPYDGVTEFRCDGVGGWKTAQCPENRLDCNAEDKDGYKDACETRGDTRNNCHACGRSCTFACGRAACDEIAQIATGTYHACLVTSEGRVACWGEGALGRLGDGDTKASSVPQLAIGVTGATAVAAGYAHSCVIAGADDSVYCWGDNSEGQLGSRVGFSTVETVDDMSVEALPVLTGRGTPVSDATSLSAGAFHACVIVRPGKLLCWGSQLDGRLANNNLGRDGIENRVPSALPALRLGRLPIEDAAAVALGEAHGCLITTSGTVECWGDNAQGQLGDDNAVTSAPLAQPVAGLSDVSAIAAGTAHTCAVSLGIVYCWGDNTLLQLGRPQGDDSAMPRPVAGLTDVRTISAGEAHTCATTAAGEVFCWGSNQSGERGDANILIASDTGTSVPIAGGRLVAAGSSFTCALTAEHRLLCWGYNLFGQLGNGNGSTDAQWTPTPIGYLSL